MLKDNSSQPVRFLCVNVEPSFIAYLMASAEPMNLSLDICKKLPDALKKIQMITYDACIIDTGSLHSEEMHMIREIREKSGRKTSIALLLEPHQDESNIRKLQEQSIVSYILRKPIYPQQIEGLINDLCQKQIELPPTSQPNKLQDLKRYYEKTIYDKIELLTRLIKELQKNPDYTSLSNLRDAVHKIGGSAGSYGYETVSKLCKQMDSQISDLIASGSSIEVKWLNDLDDFLTKIKLAFQSSASSQSYIVSSFIPRPSLFVIDHDIPFLELLERVKEQFPIELFVESNPTKAIERLNTPGFNPRALIVAQTFPGSTVNPYDILATHKMKTGMQPGVCALIMDKDDLDTRIEAMQKGVNYIFHRPVSAYVLLRSMKDALEINLMHNFKVLILDDDPDFCNFVSLILSEVGFTVKSIHNSTELLPTLQQFQPHILLLDLVLPKYDGLELLKTLRQDVAYNNLIIVIVTSSDESATRLSAYSAKADDILYKPVEKDLLQKRILSLAERHATLGQMPETQAVTGLVKVKSLASKLHDYLINPRHQKQHLVLFEIDHFADWAMQHGYSVAHEVMVNISNQLQWFKDQSMYSYSYNSSKFAIIFEGSEMKAIETKMFNFLSSLQQQLHKQISFNCSIVPLSKSFGNAHELLQAAEQGLYEARQKEPSPVKIVVLYPKGEHTERPVIFLIDPDEELLKILKNSFESHGIVVKKFTEANQALKELFSYNESMLPKLIISERKLPDIDGLDFLNRLKARFSNQIPFYFLTVFGADKDVSEGLRQGALEYIVKPFNISLLIQKALKVIFKDADLQ